MYGERYVAEETTNLVFIDKTLNAAKYIGILKKHCVPEMKQLFEDDTWTFMQDHASSHDAKATQLWLTQNVPAFYGKEEWSAKSPDLNPIENLWSILEDKID
jgi:hypothetical protein